MKAHDIGLQSLKDCKDYCEVIKEPEVDVSWELLSNRWLPDALIESFKASTYPSLVVGPPGTGKSLGTV